MKHTAALALGGFLLRKGTESFAAEIPANHPVGLQLFTLMSIIDKDTDEVMRQVARIGYKDIESAFSRKGGFYGMSPKGFRNLNKSLGLNWVSHHVLGAPFHLPKGAKMPKGPDGKPIVIPPMKTLKDSMQEIVDQASEAGLSYLVCATTPLGTLQQIEDSMKVLQRSGEACKKAGIVFAYHNHTQEFQEVEGKIPYHMLLEGIPADILKMELDVAWATKAGQNPAAIFHQHPGRFPLWHVKDLDKATQEPVEIGAGYIDFKPIFAAASVAGMKHFFVEQDGAPHPIENIRHSFQRLESIIA